VLRKLQKHRGCVNTVSFNTDGDVLVSGSDDWRVILWDWQTGSVKLSFHSGHSNNVFQAKIMPHSDDRSIVTCAADGQVSLLCQFLHFVIRISLGVSTYLADFPFISRADHLCSNFCVLTNNVTIYKKWYLLLFLLSCALILSLG